jgi:ligand-binding sensor domain-containing protein/putative methionine-R-sulfoxide reductase with GAF domain
MLLHVIHRSFLSAIIVILCYCPVKAQLPEYQVSIMQEQEDLKTAGIVDMARDKSGFLWFVSPAYVQRFDGRYNRRYLFQESITNIYIDRKDRKWVHSMNALYLFSDSLRGFQKIGFDNPNEGHVVNVYETDAGAIVVAKRSQHYVFDETGKIFRSSRSFISAGGGFYDRFYGSLGKNHFYSRGDTVFRHNTATGATHSFYLRKVGGVVPLTANTALVSTHEFKTFFVNLLTGDILPPPMTHPELAKGPLHIFNGLVIDSSRMLLRSNIGLLEYNFIYNQICAPIFFYNGRLLDNQKSTTRLYKDSFGTVYMNHPDGIFFINHASNAIQYFRNYRYKDVQMPDNNVRNFAEDGEGNIWMATTNGIVRMTMPNGELKLYNSHRDTRNLVDVPSYRQLLDDKNRLWVGTAGNGVWLLDKKTGQYRRPVFASTPNGDSTEARMNSSYVWEILRLHSGQFFIVCGGFAFVVDPKTLEAKELFFPGARQSARSAYQDSSLRIWHGSTRGLYCMDSNFNSLFRVLDSFPDKRVAAFYEWRKDKMLIGTKGLYEIELSGSAITSFKKKKGIPEERFIYSMKNDRQGYVWMGTDEGIFRYDPVKDESIAFDKTDNVQSQAFNSDAAFMTSRGIMFMGGYNGVNYFDPTKVQIASETLHPLVTYFATKSADTLPLQGKSSVRIDYADRDIDFIFTVPEFRRPYRIQYRYSLNTGEPDWNYTGTDNRIRITNLRPGKYALRVSASYDGKEWFDNKDELVFTILKPWWQTTWFRLLCVAMVVALLLGIVAFRERRREANEMKRTIEYFAHSGSEHSSTEDILWDIARNCISRLGFEDCVIYLVDKERNVLVQKAAYGDKSPRDYVIANPIELQMGAGITGYVAQSGKPVIVNDVTKDKRYIVDDEKRAAELAVPIIYEGSVIGVIDSEHSKKGFYKQRHLTTLQTIASVCSKKISTAMAMEAVKKAAVELETLNNKIQDSNFKNLRLQMNPHFLFNILTTIQYLIVSQQTAKAGQYLNVFAGFLRSILQHAEETVVPLQQELRILTMYIELESLCLDETFSWKINVSEDIDQDEILVPFMLLQPFVENAIHHGLLQKMGEKRFIITIDDDHDDYLTCVIEDNGVGRKQAALNKAKNLDAVIHKSKGIDIVKQRLELMRQKTSKDAGVEIEDTYVNGVAAGTKVRLYIPYYNEEI